MWCTKGLTPCGNYWVVVDPLGGSWGKEVWLKAFSWRWHWDTGPFLSFLLLSHHEVKMFPSSATRFYHDEMSCYRPKVKGQTNHRLKSQRVKINLSFRYFVTSMEIRLTNINTKSPCYIKELSTLLLPFYLVWEQKRKKRKSV
jgi:hypothetical protein